MSKSATKRSVKPAVECLEGRWVPAVVSVGAGQAIKTLAQAATVAQSGDTVRLDAGTYTGAGIIATWNQSNIVIEGVGDVKLDATGLNIPNRKGIFVVNGTNTTIRNIDFIGAHDSIGADKNWAGIRMQGTNLIVTQCGFFNNDNGILAGANASSDILVEYSEFGSNGYGDGQSHNMYIGNQRSFTLQYSYTHDAVVGHTVKSRANTNTIQYNWIGNTGTGSTSYEINLPNGGTAYIIGKDANTQNSTIIDWGSEGASNPSQGVFVVNNTIINDRSAGTYVRLMGTTPGPVQVLNNLFAGTGAAGTTVYSGQAATQAGNLVSANPGFVNAAARDYRLNTGSAAVNAGVNPGSANGVSLTPTKQYVAVASTQARPVSGALDVGAYEVATAPSNTAPTVQTAARASANPVTGTTVALSVLGADNGGEAGLTYTWATTGTPPAAVSFSANGTNAAKNTTATFTRAGIYNFQVTIRDAGGLTVTSNVSVTVSQTLSSIVVTPASWSLTSGQTQQFSATARDQFGVALSTQPAFTWALASGVGSVSSTGLYTTPAGTGSASIRVTSGSVSATAAVTVVAPSNTPPTVQTAARASANPVTGTSVALSVLGADSAGEGTLTYSWGTTGTPPAGVSFSANGTNAAKNTTATFSRAGVYTFQVTIRDAGGLSVTSSVSVTVNQTLTSIAVTPASVSLSNGGTQQFSATGRDQFGVNLATAPAFAWSLASGIGSVSSAGLYTAPATGSGAASVRVTSGTVSATAAVTVVAAPVGQGTGLSATYFDNMDFTGPTLTRTDATVNFNWGSGSPAASIAPDTFSARWTGQVQPRYTETYTFHTTTDDGVRLYVNNQLIINNWTNHSPTVNSGTITLTAGQKYDIRLEYFENGGGAVMKLEWQSARQAREVIPQSQLFLPAAAVPSAGLTATYFDNKDFTGASVTRTDANVNFNWGTGAPVAGIGADTFSARWTGQITARYTETYTFFTTSDDGIRLWVNGQLIINQWNDHAPTTHSGTIALTAGQPVDIRLEYYENGGGAVAKLEWQSARQVREIVPTSQLSSYSSFEELALTTRLV